MIRSRPLPRRLRTAESARPAETPVLALLLALAAAAVAITWTWLAPRPRPAPAVFWGFDVSPSQSEEERRRLLGVMDQVVETCLPEGTGVRLWAFARRPEEVYSGAPAEAAELRPVQADLLERLPPDGEQGTHPARVLAEMLPPLGKAGAAGRTTAVILMWDGDDADPAATAAAAARLGKTPGLRAVWAVGVETGNREALRSRVEKSLRPHLGDRLIVSGPYDLGPGLDAFRARMQGGRQ